MAITTSAKKALRQNPKRRAKNLLYKQKIKRLVKEVQTLISQKKNEEAKKIMPQVYEALDKAAKKGVIKKNNASRRKSRLTKAVNKVS